MCACAQRAPLRHCPVRFAGKSTLCVGWRYTLCERARASFRIILHTIIISRDKQERAERAPETHPASRRRRPPPTPRTFTLPAVHTLCWRMRFRWCKTFAWRAYICTGEQLTCVQGEQLIAFMLLMMWNITNVLLRHFIMIHI